MTYALQTFWLLTESDVETYIIPETAFGVFGALAGPILTTNNTPSFSAIILRLPSVLAWVWLNIVVFDLANQRSPVAVAEDHLNKPWRPGPTGRLTPTQMRNMLLFSLPTILAINFYLGAWQETSLLFSLTWMYNDLGGGESIIGRNLVISLATGCYNSGSLRLASGAGTTLHEGGIHWILILSGVLLSTMQIQEMKDMIGDKLRNRPTLPLVWGEEVARWSVAVPVLAWSVGCPMFLRLGFLAFVLPVTLGAYVAYRTLWMRGPDIDRRSWQVWAIWIISLYTLPLFKFHQVSLDRLLMQPWQLQSISAPTSRLELWRISHQMLDVYLCLRATVLRNRDYLAMHEHTCFLFDYLTAR